jgi:hypothetical protein
VSHTLIYQNGTTWRKKKCDMETCLVQDACYVDLLSIAHVLCWHLLLPTVWTALWVQSPDPLKMEHMGVAFFLLLTGLVLSLLGMGHSLTSTNCRLRQLHHGSPVSAVCITRASKNFVFSRPNISWHKNDKKLLLFLFDRCWTGPLLRIENMEKIFKYVMHS